VGAVVVLGLVCTALAFVAYFNLIQSAGPARAVLITYVNPAVAVLLGVIVLGERATPVTAAGFCLIVLGSWLATRQPRSAGVRPASTV
jgi:drug/metabolite transporter (DMT)-like permease